MIEIENSIVDVQDIFAGEVGALRPQ